MNPRGHTRISRLFVFTPVSGYSQVEADLRYDTTDPYAITALFHPAGADEVRWVFARDLLEQGLVRWVGEGDVRIGPDLTDPESTGVELISPSSRVLLRVSTRQVVDFLDETYRAVPPGAQESWLDIDTQIERFLALSARTLRDPHTPR
ncbi:MAG: SsgA family sporulation/cell division regulator [Kibdelosporangium sp.]